MNAFELADMAALVSVHGRRLVVADPRTAERSLAAYWKASRCRLDRWGHNLRSLRTIADSQAWPEGCAGFVQEILVSEILSRIIAAIALGHDEHLERAEFAPIARNIFAGHVDTRRRAIALVETAGQVETERGQTILALGRQSCRWSDLLLAYLSPHVDVTEFAVSPARVHDFAYDARQHLESASSADMAVTMILAGMRSSLAHLSSNRTPNADLNLEIATAVVSWFEPALFDSFGLLRSQWQARLRSVPNEALAQLDQWWQPPPVVSATSSVARWRW